MEHQPAPIGSRSSGVYRIRRTRMKKVRIYFRRAFIAWLPLDSEPKSGRGLASWPPYGWSRQEARGAARRMQCSNNLKQLCLSLHTFENSYRRLPMGDFKPPFWPTRHGLWQQGLPYIEQKPLYDQYRWDVNWYDPGNASAVGTHLNVMQCASSGSPNRLTSGTEAGVNWTASATDYFGISGVDGKLATYLGLTNAG